MKISDYYMDGKVSYGSFGKWWDRWPRWIRRVLNWITRRKEPDVSLHVKGYTPGEGLLPLIHREPNPEVFEVIDPITEEDIKKLFESLPPNPVDPSLVGWPEQWIEALHNYQQSKSDNATNMESVVSLEISQEDLKFLLELKHELETQDNRHTHNPVFQVRHKVREYGYDSGYSDDYAWVHPSYEVSFEPDDIDEMLEWVSDYKEGVDLATFAANEDYREEVLESIEFYKCYFRFITHVDQSFFTEKAAQEYLQRNGHNIPGEKFIYAAGSYRNFEFEKLREIILSL